MASVPSTNSPEYKPWTDYSRTTGSTNQDISLDTNFYSPDLAGDLLDEYLGAGQWGRLTQNSSSRAGANDSIPPKKFSSYANLVNKFHALLKTLSSQAGNSPAAKANLEALSNRAQTLLSSLREQLAMSPPDNASFEKLAKDLGVLLADLGEQVHRGSNQTRYALQSLADSDYMRDRGRWLHRDELYRIARGEITNDSGKTYQFTEHQRRAAQYLIDNPSEWQKIESANQTGSSRPGYMSSDDFTAFMSKTPIQDASGMIAAFNALSKDLGALLAIHREELNAGSDLTLYSLKTLVDSDFVRAQGGKLSSNDIARIARGESIVAANGLIYKFSPEQQRAAQYLLDNPSEWTKIETARGRAKLNEALAKLEETRAQAVARPVELMRLLRDTDICISQNGLNYSDLTKILNGNYSDMEKAAAKYFLDHKHKWTELETSKYKYSTPDGWANRELDMSTYDLEKAGDPTKVPLEYITQKLDAEINAIKDALDGTGNMSPASLYDVLQKTNVPIDEITADGVMTADDYAAFMTPSPAKSSSAASLINLASFNNEIQNVEKLLADLQQKLQANSGISPEDKAKFNQAIQDLATKLANLKQKIQAEKESGISTDEITKFNVEIQGVIVGLGDLQKLIQTPSDPTRRALKILAELNYTKHGHGWLDISRLKLIAAGNSVKYGDKIFLFSQEAQEAAQYFLNNPSEWKKIETAHVPTLASDGLMSPGDYDAFMRQNPNFSQISSADIAAYGGAIQNITALLANLQQMIKDNPVTPVGSSGSTPAGETGGASGNGSAGGVPGNGSTGGTSGSGSADSATGGGSSPDNSAKFREEMRDIVSRFIILQAILDAGSGISSENRDEFEAEIQNISTRLANLKQKIQADPNLSTEIKTKLNSEIDSISTLLTNLKQAGQAKSDPTRDALKVLMDSEFVRAQNGGFSREDLRRIALGESITINGTTYSFSAEQRNAAQYFFTNPSEWTKIDIAAAGVPWQSAVTEAITKLQELRATHLSRPVDLALILQETDIFRKNNGLTRSDLMTILTGNYTDMEKAAAQYFLDKAGDWNEADFSDNGVVSLWEIDAYEDRYGYDTRTVSLDHLTAKTDNQIKLLNEVLNGTKNIHDPEVVEALQRAGINIGNLNTDGKVSSDEAATYLKSTDVSASSSAELKSQTQSILTKLTGLEQMVPGSSGSAAGSAPGSGSTDSTTGGGSLTDNSTKFRDEMQDITDRLVALQAMIQAGSGISDENRDKFEAAIATLADKLAQLKSKIQGDTTLSTEIKTKLNSEIDGMSTLLTNLKQIGQKPGVATVTAAKTLLGSQFALDQNGSLNFTDVQKIAKGESITINGKTYAFTPEQRAAAQYFATNPTEWNKLSATTETSARRKEISDTLEELEIARDRAVPTTGEVLDILINIFAKLNSKIPNRRPGDTVPDYLRNDLLVVLNDKDFTEYEKAVAKYFYDNPDKWNGLDPLDVNDPHNRLDAIDVRAYKEGRISSEARQTKIPLRDILDKVEPEIQLLKDALSGAKSLDDPAVVAVLKRFGRAKDDLQGASVLTASDIQKFESQLTADSGGLVSTAAALGSAIQDIATKFADVQKTIQLVSDPTRAALMTLVESKFVSAQGGKLSYADILSIANGQSIIGADGKSYSFTEDQKNAAKYFVANPSKWTEVETADDRSLAPDTVMTAADFAVFMA